MIACIQGEVYEVLEDSLLLMVGGIGYQVFSPVNHFQPLAAVGDEVFLHTHFYVREDVCLLFGFQTKKELALFHLLFSVNGVGAKTALVMLNTLSYGELVRSIQFGNSLTLTKIAGIGKKTAERILLELKDKIIKLEPAPLAEQGQNTQETPTNNIEANIKKTAVLALTQLGYPNNTAIKFVDLALIELKAMEEPLALELMITTALKLAANG